MRAIVRPARSLVAAGLSLVLLASCGGSQPASVDPAQALRDGAAAMAKLTSVKANLKFTKGVVTFQGYTLVGAKAVVRLPSDSDTIYTVKQQDFAFSIRVVVSGGHVYVKLPFLAFTDETRSAAAYPDVAKLFDTTSGLPAVIPAGRSPKFVAADPVDGVDSNKIEATYGPDQLHGMLPQLTSAGDVDAVVWVGGSDHLIRKAVLSGPFGDKNAASSIEVDMSAFNSVVTITPPTP